MLFLFILDLIFLALWIRLLFSLLLFGVLMILALSLLFGEFYVIIINTPIKRVDVKNITDIRRTCIIIVSTIRNHKMTFYRAIIITAIP